jgi:hypothetical protein
LSNQHHGGPAGAVVTAASSSTSKKSETTTTPEGINDATSDEQSAAVQVAVLHHGIGVFFDPQNNVYVSELRICGRIVSLGTYASSELAARFVRFDRQIVVSQHDCSNQLF